jgi:hypothetical protein
MPRRSAALVFVVVFVALALPQAPPARAADDEVVPDNPAALTRARARFDMGLQLYGQGSLEESLAEFEMAQKLAPSFRLQYNIGQVQFELGNFVAALRAFQQYLVQGGERIPTDRQAQVQHEITTLDRLVAKANVRTNVPGAVIAVDEIRVGQAPLSDPVPVNPGVRRISALKAGYLPSTVTVTVARGERIDVALDLSVNTGPASAAQGSVRRLPDLRSAVEPTRTRPRIKTWLSVVTTGALAATTVGFGLFTREAHQSLQRKLDGAPKNRQPAHDGGLRMITLAAVTGGLAVGTLVAGGMAVYFAQHEGRLAPRSPPALELSFSPAPGGMIATGRF